jgi:hypothetical protein
LRTQHPDRRNLSGRERVLDEPDCTESDRLIAGKRYLIHDRDPLFTDEFLSTLKLVGESVKLPP